MSALEPREGEVFTLRVFKSFEGYRWANTYELQCVSPAATLNDLQEVARRVCSLEREPLPSSMRIYKATVSTYVPDSEPYNPESFITINLSLTGTANFSADTIPLNVCVFARKNARTGRSGKAFYRGFLSENDVSWGGDRFEIAPRRMNEINNVLNAMLATVQPLFQFVLARGTPEPTNVRIVTGFSVVNRTSFKKLDNRYFDVRD